MGKDVLFRKYHRKIPVGGEVRPTEFHLYQNHPNPFNPVTRIQFDVPKSSHVVLRVYDLLGREVRTLHDEWTSAGSRVIEFDGTNLSSGVYLCRLNADGYAETKKMILIR